MFYILIVVISLSSNFISSAATLRLELYPNVHLSALLNNIFLFEYVICIITSQLTFKNIHATFQVLTAGLSDGVTLIECFLRRSAVEKNHITVQQ